MALTPGVIDIPLGVLNQTPSDTQGPLGRLIALLDAQVKHYESQQVNASTTVPTKLSVEPRDAFVSLPQATRSIVDGTASSAPWTNPGTIGALGNQLVVTSNSVPRVFDGSNWIAYPDTRTVTRTLQSSTYHTSQHTIQAPDSAYLNGTTAVVWTETQALAAGPTTTTYIGFQSSGVSLVAPRVLFSAVAPVVTAAKVIQDGTTFFSFYNTQTNVFVDAWDTNGQHLATNTFALSSGSPTPGFWDAIATPTAGGYTALAATDHGAFLGSDTGIDLYAIKYASGVISLNHVLVDTMAGTYGLAFLGNGTGNGLSYIATYEYFDTGTIHVYELTNQAITHTYSTGIAPANTTPIPELTGFASLDNDNNVVVTFSMTQGSYFNYTSGPANDPAVRMIEVYTTDRSDVTTKIKTIQSLDQASRAFEIDGEWYVVGYYQSGSGLLYQATQQTVTHTSGDYMTGAATQPLSVQAGDFADGSTFSVTSAPSPSNAVSISVGHSSVAITGTDNVVAVTASGLSYYGIPDGTPLLRWTFANIPTAVYSGSQLVVAGGSIFSGTVTVDIVSGPSTQILTPVVDVNNTPIPTGTFTATGTVQVTRFAQYTVSALYPNVDAPTAHLFWDGLGSVTITGSGAGNNVSNAAIQRLYDPNHNLNRAAQVSPYDSTFNPNYGYGLPTVASIWVPFSTQSNGTDTYSAAISPHSPNLWGFSQGEFDSSYIGADLVVTTNAQQPANTGTFPITASTGSALITTGDSSGIIAQTFSFPYPTVNIQLTTAVPYKFNLQSIAPLSYQYQGALVSIQNSADTNNNGVYKITQINTDGTFIAEPTNGLSNQVNQQFTGSETITIFFPLTQQSPWQPTWFVVPLTGTQPIVGAFEQGLAYRDWITEADTLIPNSHFPWHVSSVVATPDGLQFVLPFRAESVTQSETLATTAGQVQAVQPEIDSTVGLRVFTLANASGQSLAQSSELLLPGAMATSFTASGFHESGISLGMEAPFLVSQSVGSSGTLGLTFSGIYEYVVVAEYTDDTGNRIFSRPSPALQVQMAGTNNVATIGGRLLWPLSTQGLPIANTYGPTTRQVTISIYRTSMVNGTPTTTHYKITSDLNVNGLAPVTSTNASGFSFPDSFTWNYVDANADVAISANEILYTDKNLLPRYPAPAFSKGVASWQNREWVIGYDGAVWFSGEKDEGDAIWWHPAFRFAFAAEDRPMALASMDSYLLVFCQSSIWYIPADQLPDATGNGSLPTPVKLPFPVGSANGFALTIKEGVLYDSTAGGVYLITRALQNEWLSEPVKETMTTVRGFAIDDQQRVFVLGDDLTIHVYDTIVKTWYQWTSPSQGLILAPYAGTVLYLGASDGTAVKVTSEQAYDLVVDNLVGIAPNIMLAPLSLGNVRGLKRVWEFQIVGGYLGPHNLNVELNYPEDDAPTTTYGPFAANPDEPYVYAINPLVEEASQFGLHIWADFNGIALPGKSFTLEMVSCQVGMDPSGLNKRPAFVRIPGR
jgi:hypothetical protein